MPPAPQNRFFIKAYRRDDGALRTALVWLANEATHRRLPGVIVIYQTDQAYALARVVGEAQATALATGTSITLHGVDISLVTIRNLEPMSLTQNVVLAVWLPDAELAKVDEARPAAMGMVPWIHDDHRAWIDRWNPIDMRTMPLPVPR